MENHITSEGERQGIVRKQNRNKHLLFLYKMTHLLNQGEKHRKSYKSPLYCVVEIEDENIKIYGTESDYQTVTPEDVDIVGRRWNGVSIEPKI